MRETHRKKRTEKQSQSQRETERDSERVRARETKKRHWIKDKNKYEYSMDADCVDK